MHHFLVVLLSEPIFTISGVVLSKKIGKMNDTNFEYILMLKWNKLTIK